MTQQHVTLNSAENGKSLFFVFCFGSGAKDGDVSLPCDHIRPPTPGLGHGRAGPQGPATIT